MSRFFLPLAILVTVVFWSSAFVGIRLGLVDFTPGALALYRFLVASVFMSVIVRYLPHGESMAMIHRLQLMVIGVVGIGLYNYCLNYGETHIDAGVASFVIGQIPVITIVLSVLILKESMPRWAWLGILLSIVGLIVIAYSNSKGQAFDIDILIIMIASASGAFYTLMQRRYLKRYHPVTITHWVLWGGTISLMIFFPDLLREFGRASLKSNLIVIYLGVGPAALAYLAWCYVLNYITASRAALFLYSLPLISTVMGYWVLHESPTSLSLIGGVISVFGAFLAQFFIRRVRV